MVQRANLPTQCSVKKEHETNEDREEKVLRSAFYIIHRVQKWEGEVCVSITSGTRKAGGRIEYVCVLGLEVQKRSEGVY